MGRTGSGRITLPTKINATGPVNRGNAFAKLTAHVLELHCRSDFCPRASLAGCLKSANPEHPEELKLKTPAVEVQGDGEEGPLHDTALDPSAAHPGWSSRIKEAVGTVFRGTKKVRGLRPCRAPCGAGCGRMNGCDVLTRGSVARVTHMPGRPTSTRRARLPLSGSHNARRRRPRPGFAWLDQSRVGTAPYWSAIVPCRSLDRARCGRRIELGPPPLPRRFGGRYPRPFPRP
jgi:hypothetical protein